MPWLKQMMNNRLKKCQWKTHDTNTKCEEKTGKKNTCHELLNQQSHWRRKKTESVCGVFFSYVKSVPSGYGRYEIENRWAKRLRNEGKIRNTISKCEFICISYAFTAAHQLTILIKLIWCLAINVSNFSIRIFCA